MRNDAISNSGLALGGGLSRRPALRGTRHMAVAGHYAAAHAAFQILEARGNAFDAGVAAGIALGVLQCDLVNVAGVAPIILYDAKSRQVRSISGLGGWPRMADVELFRRQHGGAVPEGILRTVIPAAPQAWITVLKEFGTLSFGDVASAAIRFAREGFPMYPLLADTIALNAERYRRWPSSAAIYLPGGRPPKVGDLFVQSDLAGSLQYMVDEERAASSRGGRGAGLDAARNAFYRGDIASRIVSYHKQNGGWMREADLAEFEVGMEPCARTEFNGIDVYTCGPWCQGPVLLQMLNLLEPTDLIEKGHNSLAYIHTITEAMKLAFADRERWYGDPKFVDVPLKWLLSKSYAAERRTMIRPDRAWEAMPPAGNSTAIELSERPAREEPAFPRDTSYACVIDRDGNVFSVTPSDVSFDTPVIPGTGLCPSSRGSQSWTVEGHASCMAPGKRPRLTPSPALAIKPGEFAMPFGTPGGDVQAQAMLQVFLNVVVFGMDPQLAVEMPRAATYSFPDSFEPHQYLPGRLNLESRCEQSVGDGLKALGHDFEWWPEWIWRAGAVCTILADQRRGTLTGGADPRRPCYAVGW